MSPNVLPVGERLVVRRPPIYASASRGFPFSSTLDRPPHHVDVPLQITLLLSVVMLSGCAAVPRSLDTAAPSTSSAIGAIGRELGGVALGETQVQVAATLGEPTRKTITHGLGSPRWEYASGYAVAFSGVQLTVWQVEARPPVLAATREGFGLGDSTSKFRALYRSQQPQEFTLEGLTQLQVSTPTEVLIVGFSQDDRADLVILRTEPGPP